MSLWTAGPQDPAEEHGVGATEQRLQHPLEPRGVAGEGFCGIGLQVPIVYLLPRDT